MSKFKEDKIAGGLAAGMTLNDIAEKHGVSIDMLVAEFKKGIGVEMEHTTDREVAKEIALDHLFEDPKYYTKLIDMEKSMNESAMGELDIMAKQSSNFKDFVKTFQKEFPLIEMDREAIKWLEGIYNDRTNESVNEEEKSPEEIVQGLKQMAMGDLERIGDYADMIADRMEQGQELSSWMYSQITLAVDQLNSVHDSMDGKDGVKESELKGYLAADVIDDIVKSIGSKFVKGHVENAPNRNFIYLKLTDVKFGSGVVKMLKSQFGIDAKIDKTFGNIPTVSFPSNKVISEVLNEEQYKVLGRPVILNKGKKSTGVDWTVTFQNGKSLPLADVLSLIKPFPKGITATESLKEVKTYKKGDKLKIKLPNGKKFDVVFVDYSRTKGVALGKFKDGSGEVDTKPFNLDTIVEVVNEAGLKGVENIPSNKKLSQLSDNEKLTIIQSVGNIISFKVPDWSKGRRNFWQVISAGKVKKGKSLSGETHYFLQGKGPEKASPTYKSVKDLINGVEWDTMELRRESVNEAKAGDFEMGDFVHFKSKNKTGMVKKISGDKVTIMTMKGDFTGDIKDVQVLYQDGLNEEPTPKIKNTITKKEWSKIAKYNKHIGMDGTHYVMKYDDKIGTYLQAVKLVDEIKEAHDCGCGCGGVTEDGCGTAKLESKDGLERVAAGLPQTKEEPLNEWKAEEVLQQLGGRKFIAMTGAKNFVKNDPKKQIVFKIGGGAKNGINYVRVTLTSMDLYNMEFLKARGTDLKVVASEKGVYNDQLQQMFTKHTGMNTKL